MKQTKVLTHATHVNGRFPAVYMSYTSQNFRLFHVSNLFVLNFRIFLLMYPGSATDFWTPLRPCNVRRPRRRRRRREANTRAVHGTWPPVFSRSEKSSRALWKSGQLVNTGWPLRIGSCRRRGYGAAEGWSWTTEVLLLREDTSRVRAPSWTRICRCAGIGSQWKLWPLFH